MGLHFRHIVTGHDEYGKETVVTDAVSRGMGPGIAGCEIRSTDAIPVDNAMEADPSLRAGFIENDNYRNRRGDDHSHHAWEQGMRTSRIVPRRRTTRFSSPVRSTSGSTAAKSCT